MSYGVRKKFYSSKAWNDVRKTIWIKQHLLCNRCHRPVYVDGISEYLPKEKRRTGIVHHNIYLDDSNVYDINITLNEENLEGICKECHELEHNKNNTIRPDYEFDINGNIIPSQNKKKGNMGG